LQKPWDPPEEKLYPVVGELLDDWQATYKPEYTSLRVIEYQCSPKSHAIKDFLTGNLAPYKWVDVQAHPEAEILLETYDIGHSDLPALLLNLCTNIWRLFEVFASLSILTMFREKGIFVCNLVSLKKRCCRLFWQSLCLAWG
jgi:hypothetical protein